MSRVLVIDDDPDVLELIRMILTDAGHDVRVAPDGPHGLALVRAGHFDAALVDLMMPNMDGFDVMAALRGDERGRMLPLVVVTAKTRLEDQLRSWREGATEFITKPFPPEQLLSALNRAINSTPEERGRRRTAALRQLASAEDEHVS